MTSLRLRFSLLVQPRQLDQQSQVVSVYFRSTHLGEIVAPCKFRDARLESTLHDIAREVVATLMSTVAE